MSDFQMPYFDDGQGNRGFFVDSTARAGLSYKAGDTISNENIVAVAVGANTSDCYFSLPLSKPVSAASVSLSNVTCYLYYGTNQRESLSGATFTATIQSGSLLIKAVKNNTFSQYGRYAVDFTCNITFS